MSFIELSVRTAKVVHGYDAENHEITEEIHEPDFMRKLIRVDRIQSVSDQYILVTSAFNRVMFWEYEGTFEELRTRLGYGNHLIP
jgi:hypothetical protein